MHKKGNGNNHLPSAWKAKTHWIAKAGILTAVAVVLMYLEFPLPLMPEFLKFDFSEIAVLLAAFSMGPLTGIIVELLKNLLHLPATHTGGVGELANFVVGSAFVGTAGMIYRWNKTRKGAYIGMICGTLAMTLIAAFMNYFIMLPFYIRVMEYPLEAIIQATREAGNNLITDMETLILYVFVPFNLFKGLVVSLIVAIIYKRVSPLLHK